MKRIDSSENRAEYGCYDEFELQTRMKYGLIILLDRDSILLTGVYRR